jgi:hypothetical protein
MADAQIEQQKTADVSQLEQQKLQLEVAKLELEKAKIESTERMPELRLVQMQSRK